MKKTLLSIAVLSAFVLSAGGAFVITKVLKNNASEIVSQLVTAQESTINNPSEPEDNESMDAEPVDTFEEETSENPPNGNASKISAEEKTTASQVISPIEKMTSAEFEQLLIKGTVSRNKRIASYVNIRTSGREEGDRPIDNGDLMGVSQKILNDQWKSVRVISVGYDEKNRINSVVIKPVYPEEQTESQPSEDQSDNVSQ